MVAVALLAAPGAGAATKLSRPAQQVLADYRSDAAIQPCAHTVADFRRTLRELTPDLEEEIPAFRPAIEAALREREQSKRACPHAGAQSTTRTPAAPTPGGGTAKPVSPPAPTPAPAAPAPAQRPPARPA